MGSWCLSHLTSCSSERFLWSLPASYSLAPAEEVAQGSLGMGDLRLSLILSPSWRESTFWGSPSCPCPQFKKVISSVFFRIRPQLALPTFYSPPPKKKKVKCSFHLVPSSVLIFKLWPTGLWIYLLMQHILTLFPLWTWHFSEFWGYAINNVPIHTEFACTWEKHVIVK